jgi:hypothetical protein
MSINTTVSSANLISVRATRSAPTLPTRGTVSFLQQSSTDLFERSSTGSSVDKDSPSTNSNNEPTTKPSALAKYIPETIPGKIIALVGLYFAGKLAWRATAHAAEVTGLTEGIHSISVMGLHTSWGLIKELGPGRSYEINQAEGLAVPLGLANYMGLKKTMQLARTLGPAKIFELLKS